VGQKGINMDRRKALMTLGISSLTLPHLISCGKDEQADIPKKEQAEDDRLVELLFVQEAQNVKFEDNQMTLIDVDPKTLYFADRPDEIAGYLTYKQFIDMVTEGPDNFKEDPPNATLVIMENEKFVNVVLKLSEKPRLEGKNLVFPLVEFIQGEVPAKGGKVALFIDTVGHPASPGSVAGVHRRNN
jgi:hypothetical protein